jgi:hypothetical protein
MTKLVLSADVVAFFFHISNDFVEGGKTKNVYNCKSEIVGGKMCCSRNNAFSLVKGTGVTLLELVEITVPLMLLSPLALESFLWAVIFIA